MLNRCEFVGLDVPDDFPTSEFETVAQLTDAYREAHAADETVFDAWKEWAAAWNGVAWRFISLDRYDKRFGDSIRRFPTGPSQEERHQQDEDLFNFFVTSLAVIEAFCYGVFALGSMRRPAAFPLVTEDQKRAVNPANAARAFEGAFPADGLSAFLGSAFPGRETAAQAEAASDARKWFELGQRRNQLAHRGAPPRGHRIDLFENLFRRGDQTPPSHRVLWMGEELNDQATASWRAWLAPFLQELCQHAGAFAGAREPRV